MVTKIKLHNVNAFLSPWTTCIISGLQNFPFFYVNNKRKGHYHFFSFIIITMCSFQFHCVAGPAEDSQCVLSLEKKKKKKILCFKGVDPAVERSSACELGRMQNIICYLASNTEVNAKLYLILHTDAERPAQLLGYESKTSININSIAIRASLSAGGSVISGLAFISTA